MAKHVLIEWDNQILRCGEANVVAGRVTLSNLFLVELDPERSLLEQADNIKSALNSNGIQRGDVDFVVSRRDVEMREFGVPPVPNEELPELLRFSAKNEFASVNEQWKLDFVPLSDDAEQPRNVIASALTPSRFKELESLAEKCALRIRRILLRPYCVLNGLAELDSSSNPVLIVHRNGKHLETLLAYQNLLRMNRSVLLGGLENEVSQEIRGEVSRTLLACNRTLGRSVDRLAVVGDEQNWQDSLSPIESVQKEYVAAEKVLSPTLSVRGHHPHGLMDDMLALIGAATSLSSNKVAQVDFANPRRKVVKKFDKQKFVVWSSIAAACVVFLIGLAWFMLRTADQRIELLTKELSDVKELTEPANGPSVLRIIGEVGKLDEWNAANSNWLGELGEVSKRTLTGDDVVLSSVQMRTEMDGAVVNISGNVTSADANAAMKTQLASRPFNVDPGVMKVDDKNRTYPYKFENSLSKSFSLAEKVVEVQNLAREFNQKRVKELQDAAATNGEPAKSKDSDAQ
ncbi:MAG: hypothetical protein R3C03_02380 [Pirellulaceae bacterium]